VLVLKDEIAALTNEFAETKARGALGVLTKTDVAQSEARLLSAQAQLNLAQGKLEDSNAEYLAAVGQSPGELQPEPALEQVPDKIDEAFNSADQNNPKLLAAVANEKVARGKVDEAKAANGPSVALRFDAQVAPEEPYLERQYYDSLSVMATISQPLYTSGLNSSRVRAALDEDDRAQLDVESARRAAVQAVSQAWSEMASTDTAVTIEERQLAVEQEAVKGNRIEERAGLRQNIELLNAELELTNARIGLVQGRHDAYLARVRLLAAMGLLEVRMLDAHAQTFDPAAAFRAVKGRWQVPWDGIVAAFDSFGAPSTPRPRLSAPGAGSQRPAPVVAP
jgi:outer membrane protein